VTTSHLLEPTSTGRTPHSPLTEWTSAAIGLAALVVIVATSWTQGAVLMPFDAAHARGVQRCLYFGGLAVLAGAWLLLLRRSVDGRLPLRTAQAIGVLWAVPLLAAVPLGSRDPYAYAAQGDVLQHGRNPYDVGVTVLHDAYPQQVSAIWRTAVSPYGPVWTEVSRAAVALAGDHPLRATLMLRIPAFVALLLILGSVPRLARAAGGSPARAVTLFGLNPFVLVIGLGGAHNDIVMLGLAAAGLWLAVIRPRWWTLAAAAALITLAAAVKLPAVVVLAFLPLLWVRARPTASRLSLLGAVGVTGVVAGGIAMLTAWLTRLPQGWRPPPDQIHPWLGWLSVPLDLVYIGRYVDGGRRGVLTAITPADQHDVAALALAATGVLLVGCWLLALRGRPWGWLAGALGLAVVCATAIESWYGLWCLLFLSALPLRRRLVGWIAGAALGFALAMGPDGVPVTHSVVSVPLFALAGAAARWAVHFRSGRQDLNLRPSDPQSDALPS
jgi:alpha-1,6-mannosyltransferase